MERGGPIICLVTDRSRLPRPGDASVVRLAKHAAAAGVSVIQVRERDLDDRRLFDLTRRIAAAVSGTGCRVVVNDRVDVAIAAGADGVHLRGDSVAAGRAREIAPAGFLIGRSVHTAAEAVAAARSGVDYLIMGTVYPTASKPGDAPLCGLHGLRQACQAVTVPVLAIGGITTDKVDGVAAAGAAGVAAVGLFSSLLDVGSVESLDAALGDVVGAIRRAFLPMIG
jgi:thiamine-phosphate pyrophosphorylase